MSTEARDHDRILRQLVEPLAANNPDPLARYDLAVIGAGTAGLVAAAGAASLGARVALIEKNLLGGDCLNYGCVPSKALLSAARDVAMRRSRDGRATPVERERDFDAAMQRMRRLRAEISRHDSVERFSSLGVHVFRGCARFVSADTIAVDSASIRFRRALIATGSRPVVPPIPGLASCAFLTNETIFSLARLPEQLVIIGAGPIGVEMGQAFARFGSEVTLLGGAERILPRDDPDAAEVVAGALRGDGVRILTGIEIRGVSRSGNRHFVSVGHGARIEIIACDALLVAAGRAPDLAALSPEAAGVATNRSGIVVDDRLRTTNRRIYAAGDAVATLKFTHHADAQARIVIAHALFHARLSAGRMVVPWCTYTNPEIAHVGLSAAGAAQQGIAITTITVPFAEIDRAIVEETTEGFARIHLRRGRDKIVGATIVGAHAGELIGHVAAAMTNRLGLSDLGRVIYPYPTRSEVLRRAADVWRKSKLTPTMRRLLRGWFRLFG